MICQEKDKCPNGQNNTKEHIQRRKHECQVNEKVALFL